MWDPADTLIRVNQILITTTINYQAMKRILLTLLIAFAALPRLSAAVGDDFTYEGLVYTILDEDAKTCKTKDGRKIDGLDGYDSCGNYVIGDLVIPDKVKNNEAEYSVVEIGNGAFALCKGLTSIVIPTTVTLIGDFAFYECWDLVSADIPNSVRRIGDFAFGGCSSLLALVLPDSVISIGNSAFWGCSSITAVNLPSSIEFIGTDVFSACKMLTQVNIPDSWTKIPTATFIGCESLANITIPSTLKEIEGAAFAWSGLESIEIPNSVTFLGAGVFSQCNKLTSAILPNSITTIDVSLFEGCSALVNIEIPNSVTSICNGAFWGCGNISSLDIPMSVITIGDNAFSGLGVTSIELSNPETTIGENVFSGCRKLESFNIPASWTKIPNGTFSWCESLTNIKIPNTIREIGSDAFSCSGLKSIDIPNSVTVIGDGAFLKTGLVSIDIPSSVTTLGSAVFRECTDLTSIIIPNSVKTLGRFIFGNCVNLHLIELPNSITSIDEYAFSGCNGLEQIDIPNSVETIGYNAFESCKNLKSIKLSNRLSRIENELFRGCESLLSIDIPNSVSNIGYSAFYDCKNLNSVKIPNSVKKIESFAFSGCKNLVLVDIPSSISYISNEFRGCSTLSKVAIGANTVNISVNAFEECRKLNEVMITALVPPVALDNSFCSETYQGTLYVDETALDDYRNAPSCWSNFSKIESLVNPTELKLSESEIWYNPNVKTIQLSATLLPENVSIPVIYWESSNPEVVTVDNNGLISFEMPVTEDMQDLEIRATTLYANGPIAICKILPQVLCKEIALDKTELTLTIEASEKLTATVLPEDVTDKTVTWSTSDATIATVDNEGNVTAISVGEATITVTCGDKSATCKVTVNPILAECISLDKTELTLTIGASEKLTATVLPEDVTDKTVTWLTSDAAIATVDNEGNVTAISVGEATITATCGDKSATCKVTVNPILADSITLDKTELTLTIGASEKLTATVLPDDVTDKTVSWSTSDASIATVDTEGNVTAISVGEATITATCGDKSATCKVTVYPILAESITLDKTELTLTIGASEKLTATVLPEDVTDKTVTWSTSDASIATVDNEGNVTAVSVGEATITATCGDKSATCKVTVNPILAESITLDKTELTLTIGASEKLTAIVLPEEVTDKTVTWSTSDATIATVDNEGNVTAISVGEATITATCGEISTSCRVIVEKISGIVFVSADDINIVVNGNELTIRGATSEDKVTIVRQDGAVIYSGNNRESYTLVRGLYLVIVNGATYKVVIH